MKSVSTVWLAKEWTTPRDVLMSNFSTAILKKKKKKAWLIFFKSWGINLASTLWLQWPSGQGKSKSFYTLIETVFEHSIFSTSALDLPLGHLLRIFYSTLTTYRGFMFSWLLPYSSKHYEDTIFAIISFLLVFQTAGWKQILPNNLICHSQLHLCENLTLNPNTCWISNCWC